MAARHDTTTAIPWEILRDAYAASFGELVDVRTELDFGDWRTPPEDRPSPFLPDGSLDEALLLSDTYEDIVAAQALYNELFFGDATPEDSRSTLATFGAAPFTGGHEVFLTSSLPFLYFDGIPGELVEHHGPLAPGKIVPMDIQWTPFKAVLLAHVGAGSIALGDVDGAPRYALRIVPLTPMELALSARSLDALVARLRAAGALDVADPMRDCVVFPQGTKRFWKKLAPPFLRETARRQKWRRGQIEELLALDAQASLLDRERILLEHGELLLARIRAHQAKRAARHKQVNRAGRRLRGFLDDALAATSKLLDEGAIPRVIAEPCAEIVAATVAAHPIVERLLWHEVGVGDLHLFEPSNLPERLVNLVRRVRPDADADLLRSAGEAGLVAARETGTGADGFLPPHATWAFVVKSMCLTACESVRAGDRRVALAVAIEAGVDMANELFNSDDARPLMERLDAGCRAIVLAMAQRWLALRGSDEAAPSTSSPPRQRRKPRTYH